MRHDRDQQLDAALCRGSALRRAATAAPAIPTPPPETSSGLPSTRSSASRVLSTRSGGGDSPAVPPPARDTTPHAAAERAARRIGMERGLDLGDHARRDPLEVADAPDVVGHLTQNLLCVVVFAEETPVQADSAIACRQRARPARAFRRRSRPSRARAGTSTAADRCGAGRRRSA